ncbi:SIS domain-containing protein [Streptomyces sp. MK37H]|uniref:SIS domain-containing protein n=1 Tax=Streptomyces sp. MK37H TaxID=2699117 RepID=UPI001B3687ED|nr:SIS domain-containing protein [Streptomyces sp. MK37H]MBP8534530.1 SIS domain-containing protein [Streptomyces sp. MK37H]
MTGRNDPNPRAGAGIQAPPPPLDPSVMLRQADALAGDLRERTGPFDERVRALLPARWAAVDTVSIVGDGDSYHAACAVRMAFASLAGVDCRPVNALRFVEYDHPGDHPVDRPVGRPGAEGRPPRHELTLAVSASGRTPLVVRSAERAREGGAHAIAVTGTPDSPLARAADDTLLVTLPDTERSPGVRTYQASVLGLLLIAIRLGTLRGRLTGQEADALRGELSALAGPVEATVAAARSRCPEIAERIADAAVLSVLGSGPSHGTALFAAAKVIETSGVFATGQDLEEWCHVERFARPPGTPVIVVAAPGRTYGHAAEVAARAAALGRRVITVAPEDDSAITRQGWAALPVTGRVREEFSPLLYHVFAAPLSCHLAQLLGRAPFLADLPRPTPTTTPRHRGETP